HEGAKGMIEIIALRESQHPLKALKAVPTLYRVARGKSDADLVDYFRNRVPAILDLLPLERTNYLYSIEGEVRTDYPFGYPENTRLERLSSPQALKVLAQTEEI